MPKLSEAQGRALRMMMTYNCFAIQHIRGHCYYLPAKWGDYTPYPVWATPLRGNTLASLQRRQLVGIAAVGDRASRDTTFYVLTSKGREVAKELQSAKAE